MMFQDFKELKDKVEFFESAADESVLDEIRKASNLVVTSVKEKKLSTKRLERMSKAVKDRDDRDKRIAKAYEKGYSQHAIAQSIGLSQPYINKIVKKTRVI